MNSSITPLAVVVGGIGTDITGLELNRLVGPGELEFGGVLKIGAGGKSRNMAQMIATLLGPNQVAMVGKTSRDPLGLWKVPIDSLRNAGVNVDFINILEFSETGKFPQVALIAVDKQGNNQIYVIPGINNDFSPTDIAAARSIFESVKSVGGITVLSLELPIPTAVATIGLANSIGMRVLFDPGGICPGLDYSELFKKEIYLIKPNEHETFILTDIQVRDTESARQAAHVFLRKGVQNVLITLGKDGAFFCNDSLERFIPIPKLVARSHHSSTDACEADHSHGLNNQDETGCGDQTMATLCARLLSGDDLLLAAQRAVLAGTLQFHKLGIVPVTAVEIAHYF